MGKLWKRTLVSKILSRRWNRSARYNHIKCTTFINKMCYTDTNSTTTAPVPCSKQQQLWFLCHNIAKLTRQNGTQAHTHPAIIERYGSGTRILKPNIRRLGRLTKHCGCFVTHEWAHVHPQSCMHMLCNTLGIYFAMCGNCHGSACNMSTMVNISQLLRQQRWLDEMQNHVEILLSGARMTRLLTVFRFDQKHTVTCVYFVDFCSVKMLVD